MKKTQAEFMIIADSRFTDDVEAEFKRLQSGMLKAAEELGIVPIYPMGTTPRIVEFPDSPDGPIKSMRLNVRFPKSGTWNELYAAVNSNMKPVHFELI